MLVAIMILEEALGIEAVAADNLLEALDHVVDTGNLLLGRMLHAVVCHSHRVTKRNVYRFLEVLLSKHRVDIVAESTPANVFTLLRCFVISTEQLIL